MKLPFKFPGWVLFALAGLAMIVAPLVIWLPRYTTSSPAYCLECHSSGETPNRGIPSKVHPPFSQVTCTDCHAKPGQVVYEGYLKGFMSEPERVSPNCRSCHQDISARNDQEGFKFNILDIKIPHKLHFDLGAKCTDCHANVAHDLKGPQSNRPRMEYCSQCHAATREACGKCHGKGVPPGPIPAVVPAGMVADGKALYTRYCAECHGLKGDQIPGADLRSNEFLTNQGFFALEEIASQGHGGMPAFSKEVGGPLTDDEIRAIIAHLKLSAEGPGQINGQVLYDKNCAVCHGVKGKKMPTVDLSSPEYLRGLSDDVIVKAISEGKGAMPAWGKPKGGNLSYDEIVAIERYATSLAGVQFREISIRGLYIEDCAPCHGETGDLITSANMGSRDFLTSRGDEAFIQAVAQGKGGMPAFSTAKGGTLSDDQIISLLQYLKARVGLVAYAVARTIPHDLAGRDNCVACHGPEGSRPVPANHEGRMVDTCLNCHQPAIVQPAATPSVGIGPLAIPHPIGGRAEQCLACHETGVAGTSQIPDDHVGRTDDTCQACHQPAPTTEAVPAAESPTPAPTTEAVPATEATTPEVTPTAAGPLPIPHTLEGRENCLECHISPEATLIPEEGPLAIPHPLTGRENCLACHQEGIGGASQIPDDHAGRTDDTCQACHQPG